MTAGASLIAENQYPDKVNKLGQRTVYYNDNTQGKKSIRFRIQAHKRYTILKTTTRQSKLVPQYRPKNAYCTNNTHTHARRAQHFVLLITTPYIQVAMNTHVELPLNGLPFKK